MYTIYKITDVATGKIYVGMTTRLAHRLAVHRSSAGLFHEREHLTDVLCRAPGKAEAMALEQFWVTKLRATDPSVGYNVNVGTRHAPSTRRKIGDKALGRESPLKGRTLSDAERERKAARRGGKGYLRGEDHPNFGRQTDEETRRKMSESQRDRAARGDTPFLGCKHSEATKAKMRGPRPGLERPWLRKPVRNLDTGHVFGSLDEAAASIGLTKHAISRVCRGKCQTAGGFRWSFD